jgi:hypothetical protein
MAITLVDGASLSRTTGLVPFSSNHTVMVWCRDEDFTEVVVPVYYGNDPVTLYTQYVTWYLFDTDHATRYFDAWVGPPDTQATGSPYDQGAGSLAWHHHAYVRQGTSHTWYRDGVAIATATVNVSGSTATILLLNNDTYQTDTASYEYFREWDAALTVDEITTEMNSGVPVRHVDLWTDAPLGNPSDLADHGGQGHHFSLSGTIQTTTTEPPVAAPGDQSIVCCEPAKNPVTGEIEDTTGPRVEPDQTQPLPEWDTLCVGGGTVPDAADVVDSEAWA